MNVTLSLAEFSGVVAGLAAFFSTPLVVLWRMVVRRNDDCEKRLAVLETEIGKLQEQRFNDHKTLHAASIEAFSEVTEVLRDLRDDVRARRSNP